MSKRWLKNCPTANPQVQALVSYWFTRHCLRWNDAALTPTWPTADAGATDGILVTSAPQEFTTVGSYFAVGDIGKLLAVYDPNEERNVGIFLISAFTDASTITLAAPCAWAADAVNIDWVLFDPSVVPALDEWAVVTPSDADVNFEAMMMPRTTPHPGLAFQVGPTGGWAYSSTSPIPGAINDAEMEQAGIAHWTPSGVALPSKSTAHVHNGAQSLTYTSAGIGAIDSDIFNGLIDGENYDLKLWVYVDSAPQITPRIWDGTGWQTYSSIGVLGWVQHTLNFTKQAGGDAYLQFVVPAGVGLNTTFIDDVTVENTWSTPGPSPIVIAGIPADGDMELVGTANWSISSMTSRNKTGVQAHSGTQSLSAVNITGTDGYIWSGFFSGYRSGISYELKFWAYVTAAPLVTPQVNLNSGPVSIPPMPVNPSWVEYTIPYIAESALLPRARFVVPTGTGWLNFFLDDFTITQTNAGPLHITDGDMEETDTYYWYGSGSPAPTLDKVGAPVHSGTQSMRINNASSGDGVGSPYFACTTEGSAYTVSIWTNISLGRGPVTPRLWTGSATIVFPDIIATGSWVQDTFTFTKVGGVLNPARIFFSFGAGGSGTSDTYFDDLTITEVGGGASVPADFANTATDLVNLDPNSTTLFACGDDDHCFFWDEGGADRAGAYIGNITPLHAPSSVYAIGDTSPSCVLGVDNAAPVLNRSTVPVTSFAQGGSAVFSDDTTVVTCYLNEWQTSDGTATDVFGDINFLVNPRTTTSTAWEIMILHRETASLGARSKAIRGEAKSIYIVNDNNANRTLLEGDTVYVIQNGLAVAWDGSVPI